MTAENQMYHGGKQEQSVLETAQRHAACQEEHQCWADLIDWMKTLGLADAELLEQADAFLRETEEMIRKTELFLTQKGAILAAVKETVCQWQ